MELAKEAFAELFPDKNINDYGFRINYTGRFKPYNANVRYRKTLAQYSMQFNLSKKWRGISREIQIGLIQGLMLRIFKEKNKIKTLNMELYEHFMRSIHISAPKINSEPILEDSFNRVNEKHFFGMMEKPNLVRHNSVRRLGSYEYGSDTISISEILLSDIKVLDYVMYHEMLHKKFKYSSDNGRTCHHSREFKKEEEKFENSGEMERKIKEIIRNIKLNFLY